MSTHQDPPASPEQHRIPGTSPAPAGLRVTPLLLVTLGLLTAVAPFATDLYLPAFPEMLDDLDTTASGVQVTLTAFLLGLAVGQLVFGPVSDRFGRRVPLIVGAAIYVAASTIAVLAPNVEVLTAARFAQGVTGAAGMVIARAVIADLATGRAAARAFSLMMLVVGVAPVIAPLIGGILADPLGWRGLLGVVLGLAVLMLAGVLTVVPESLPRSRRDELRALQSTHGSGARDLGSAVFVGNTLAFGFGFAVMMSYIAASPFVYQVMMGVGPVVYGLGFGVNALGLMAMTWVAARLAASVEPARLVAVGLSAILTGAVAFLALSLSGAPAGWLAVPLFVCVSSLGLVMGNATALALGAVPRAAGTGSAVLGATQFALGAAVAPIVGVGGESTALPLAIVMVACAGLALGSFTVASRVAARASR
ncbi:Bcr/CflA family drug resistance efflux transporter [Agromyces rhizosphaerae]|uniref:Bcr/CflA family drug resistance efflux transporter n=1 Tax=Agromyces rhizosphaerae TaxID=88374 RepID=A0A9W6FPU5_9MICO|nr:multidrug effflux MFS transporter [Agromyces rhizosphaerae]GLI27886.1 Bcr/CflA family drug resistance efflux transporter [Agromyces rhizosphaerae]